MLHARDEQARKSVELPLDLPGGPALRQVLERAAPVVSGRWRNGLSRHEPARAVAASYAAEVDERASLKIRHPDVIAFAVDDCVQAR